MKIEKITIKNFRALKDVEIAFSDFTSFVGANGAGKSTVFHALNLFFDQRAVGLDPKNLTAEDFFGKDTSQDIDVTVYFVNLSTEAQESFQHYVRNQKLVVTLRAHYDPDTKSISSKRLGQRLVLKDFERYFSADNSGVKAQDLRRIYQELKSSISELPEENSKQGMSSALRTYEENNPDKCQLSLSDDILYGIDGLNKLTKHVQWVYVPAVKDASTEEFESKNTALGQLIQRTVRSQTDFANSVPKLRDQVRQDYEKLLQDNTESLRSIGESLSNRLKQWAHPQADIRLQWTYDKEKSIRVEEPTATITAGDESFIGQISKLGHGLQRSYLFALLQELAAQGGNTSSSNPRLVLAIEEPELYQHPPQARHLSDVMNELAKNGNQVMVTTHNSAFVTGLGFEDVRQVRKNNRMLGSVVTQLEFGQIQQLCNRAGISVPQKPEGIMAKIHQDFQRGIADMLFCERPILVEGLEDEAYITSYLRLTNRWEEFRKLGCHIIPVGGKSSFTFPIAIAILLRLPVLVIADSDGLEYSDQKKPKDPKRNERFSSEKQQHLNDNLRLLNICSSEGDPFPSQNWSCDNLWLWHGNIATGLLNGESSEVDRIKTMARTAIGDPGSTEKNSMYIASLLELALKRGQSLSNLSSLSNWLLRSEIPLLPVPEGRKEKVDVALKKS